MSRKQRFIAPLDSASESALRAGYEQSRSVPFRERCQAILLSASGHSISELASIYSTTVHTIGTWLNRWESGGIEGLKTKIGQGRKKKIQSDNTALIAQIEKKVAVHPKQLDKVLAELQADSSILMSRKTLKRFLKKVVTVGSDLDVT